MVDPFLDACSCAGKPCSTLFHKLNSEHPGINADGVAQHWAVDYDVQAILMGVVIETGCVTIGDLVAALPGHPAPVTAIMALVDAGHLSRAPGVLTPFTVISCGRDIESKGPPGADLNDRAPRGKWPSSSRTLIAFPSQRSAESHSPEQSVGTNGVERGRIVRLVIRFARRPAHLISLALAKAVRARQHRQKPSRARALVSGAASRPTGGRVLKSSRAPMRTRPCAATLRM